MISTDQAMRELRELYDPDRAIKDRHELHALRREVANSLAQMMRECEANGTLPEHDVSADGYRVFCIGIGDAELLLAMRNTRRKLQVRYVYLDGRDEVPTRGELVLRDVNG